MIVAKILSGLALLILPVFGFGQVPQDASKVVYPGGASLALILASPENDGIAAAQLADRDIAAGRLFLLLQSSIAPVVYTRDSVFCQKFRIAYWEEGCSGPDYVCMQAYNQRVFEHLTTQYKKDWQRTVRQDVIGYKQWRKGK